VLYSTEGTIKTEVEAPHFIGFLAFYTEASINTDGTPDSVSQLPGKSMVQHHQTIGSKMSPKQYQVQ